MKDKEMAELLAGTYQRQYHHNTYPELSDNSEFVTSKEEIKKACMQMAEWKEKQMIEKAVEWLKEQEELIGVSFQDDFLERFQNYMKGE